jgi:hypothetical protein
VANQLNLSPQEIIGVLDKVLSGNVPGKYAAAYREILRLNEEHVARGEPGLDALTLRWFQGAPEINESNPNASASTYVRAVTVFGLQWDGRVVPDLQVLSNTIGSLVIQDIVNNGGVPSVAEFLLNDINGALQSGNVTISGWGGSFYYWNLPYLNPATNQWSTIGAVISSNPSDLEKFLAINAAAAADAMAAHGITWDTLKAAWYAQLPGPLQDEIMSRVFNYIAQGFLGEDRGLLAGNPYLIDGYRYQNGKWFGADNIEVTDTNKIAELDTRMSIRESRGYSIDADTSWSNRPQPGPLRTVEEFLDLNNRIIFDDINNDYNWFKHWIYLHDGTIMQTEKVFDDGSSTATWFGEQIGQAMASPLALGPFASWEQYFNFASPGADVTDLSSFTQWRTIDANEGVTTGSILQGVDGSRTEVRVRPTSPFSDVVVWEHTEYSPGGEPVGYYYSTTLRATGKPVIVSWEREVGADGEPTGEWQALPPRKYNPDAPEPDEMTAAQIGEIFGSQLGSLIAGSNPFAQVLAGSALATVLGNIGGAIAWFNGDPADDGNGDGDSPASLTEEIEDLQLPEFSNFFTILKGRATGALSSFLAAELGEALGLEGFGGQLFTTVASSTIGNVLNTVVGRSAECNALSLASAPAARAARCTRAGARVHPTGAGWREGAGSPSGAGRRRRGCRGRAACAPGSRSPPGSPPRRSAQSAPSRSIRGRRRATG